MKLGLDRPFHHFSDVRLCFIYRLSTSQKRPTVGRSARKLEPELAFETFFTNEVCMAFFVPILHTLGWNRLFYSTSTSYCPNAAANFYDDLSIVAGHLWPCFMCPVSNEYIELSPAFIASILGFDLTPTIHLQEDWEHPLSRLAPIVDLTARLNAKGDAVLISSLHRNQIAVLEWIRKNIVPTTENVNKDQLTILRAIQAKFELSDTGAPNTTGGVVTWSICRTLAEVIQQTFTTKKTKVCRLPVLITKIMEMSGFDLRGEVRICCESARVSPMIRDNPKGDWAIDTRALQLRAAGQQGYVPPQRDPYEELEERDVIEGDWMAMRNISIEASRIGRDYSRGRFDSSQTREERILEELAQLRQTEAAHYQELSQRLSVSDQRQTESYQMLTEIRAEQRAQRGLLDRIFGCLGGSSTRD